MLLTPGYYYARVPGGLKRSKLPPKAKLFSRRCRNRARHLDMPCGYCASGQLPRLDPTHGDPSYFHTRSAPNDYCVHTNEYHQYSSDYRSSELRPKRHTHHQRHSGRTRQREPEMFRDSRSGDEGNRRRSRRKSVLVDPKPRISPEPDQDFDSLSSGDDGDEDFPPARGIDESNARLDDQSPIRTRRRYTRTAYAREGGNSRDSRNEETQAAGRSGTPLIAFEAAAAKLNGITNRAIDFFSSFQEDFENEVYHLTAYANRQTIRSIWKDRVLRNEKYNDKPKQGWKGFDRSDSRGHGRESRDREKEQPTNDGTGDGREATDGVVDHGKDDDYLNNFGEHQSDLRRGISLLLNCQILQPKVRCGPGVSGTYVRRDRSSSSDDDDYLEPEDTQNLERYNSALKLCKRVNECQKDLLPLLDRIRHDQRHMAAALIELSVLAKLLVAYDKAWRSPADGHNRKHRHDNDTQERAGW